MKFAVFVLLLSTLVTLEVSCQRCGPLRGCAENQCCAILPLLVRQCRNLGEEGDRCGLGIVNCPCMEGLTCLNFRCVDMQTTTTEEAETTTAEGETTTAEEETTTAEGETTTAEEETTTAEMETTTAEEETTAAEESTTAEDTTTAEATTTT